MVRRWVTLDGEIRHEGEWDLKPIDRCFFCDKYLILAQTHVCETSFDGRHEWVSLIDPTY